MSPGEYYVPRSVSDPRYMFRVCCQKYTAGGPKSYDGRRYNDHATSGVPTLILEQKERWSCCLTVHGVVTAGQGQGT
jgi:hypothetical protein